MPVKLQHPHIDAHQGHLHPFIDAHQGHLHPYIDAHQGHLLPWFRLASMRGQARFHTSLNACSVSICISKCCCVVVQCKIAVPSTATFLPLIHVGIRTFNLFCHAFNSISLTVGVYLLQD